MKYFDPSLETELIVDASPSLEENNR